MHPKVFSAWARSEESSSSSLGTPHFYGPEVPLLTREYLDSLRERARLGHRQRAYPTRLAALNGIARAENFENWSAVVRARKMFVAAQEAR